MKPTRKLNRRSFLATVAGASAAVGAGALGIIGGSARAQTGPYTGVTDTDSGSHADNAGHGRGPGGNSSGQPQNQPQTGHTDRDPSDPVGGGRGGGVTGYSDTDPTDPSGRGRNRRQETGITDSDTGPFRDAIGRGRGPQPGPNRARESRNRPDDVCVVPTGHTDSDSGQTRDPAGYGNGGSPGRNFCDPSGR